MHLSDIEKSICAFENHLHVSITAIDNQGAFLSPAGIITFNSRRKSHRKNNVCKIGFCDRCKQHCRYEMNARAEANPGIFVETCWKGITEIVAPLNIDGTHVGMFYVGSWRKPESTPPNELGRKFVAAFTKLPEYDQQTMDEMIYIVQVYIKGIIAELTEQCVLNIPDDSRAGQIRKFFQNNALKQVEMHDLCKHLGLSRSRVSYLLKHYFAKGFLPLLHEVRIQEAKTMLIGTDDTISTIARKSGFSDEYHFIRVFKKMCGFPPGKYRKMATTD